MIHDCKSLLRVNFKRGGTFILITAHQNMKLFRVMPVPGTTIPEPKPFPSECVHLHPPGAGVSTRSSSGELNFQTRGTGLESLWNAEEGRAPEDAASLVDHVEVRCGALALVPRPRVARCHRERAFPRRLYKGRNVILQSSLSSHTKHEISRSVFHSRKCTEQGGGGARTTRRPSSSERQQLRREAVGVARGRPGAGLAVGEAVIGSVKN